MKLPREDVASLKPLDAQVRGLLYGKMNQVTDGKTIILTPKQIPVKNVAQTVYTPQQAAAPSCCIPVEWDGAITRDPESNPYSIGDTITLTATNPPTIGTEPYTYDWWINGDLDSNSESYDYTVSAGDVEFIDANTGVGVIFIQLVIRNACMAIMSDTFFYINVQT